MHKLDREILDILKSENLYSELFKGKFGLEKESLRVDKKGKLSNKDFPDVFMDKGDNPFITTDFSESQIEIITPPLDSIEDSYNFLDTLHNIVSNNIGSDLLWPQSLLPELPKNDKIRIAEFNPKNNETVSELTSYRDKLAQKYGSKMQLISGIHYNFSFSDKLIKSIYKKDVKKGSYRDFKDNIYMRVIRNITRMSWFIIRLLGSSPVSASKNMDSCRYIIEKGVNCDSATSIRNGSCGYKNSRDFNVPLHSLESYVNTIKALLDSGELINEKEYYSTIRPKNSRGGLDKLYAEGIEYLELRLLDINPLYKLGVSLEDLKFIHLIIITALLMEDDPKEDIMEESIKNNRVVADSGIDSSTYINISGKKSTIKELSDNYYSLITKAVETTKYNTSENLKILGKYLEMGNGGNKLYSEVIDSEIRKRGFMKYHLDNAILYRDESNGRIFNITGYEDLELSTQILIIDSLKRGITYEVLDRKENFIKLSKGSKVEYIKQATKTSVDNYSSVLVMENKIVTKEVLAREGLKVPAGAIYISREEAIKDFTLYKGRKVVIKPNTTNFGIGITIFVDSFTLEDYEKAVDLAFNSDESILIEDFAEGKEYRVFVIGDEVVGVLHRVPANVTGDGIKTIRELIEEKNRNPIRGKGYKKPLEFIRTGVEEEMFLNQQKLTFDSVVSKGVTVFLRENSNISTGGDSIDYTDVISSHLKDRAIEAARAVGAKIVGVDLITRDISDELELDYTIIELNFNPAIHIHCFPLIGKNRMLGDKVLNILGF